MVLDFAKECIENTEPNWKDLKDLLRKWEFKTMDLENVEITTICGNDKIFIKLEYGVKK